MNIDNKQDSVSFKEIIWNGIIFSFVFIVALGVATQSLARKVNSFQTLDNSILFHVDKQDIDIITSVANSRIKEIKVSPGEHVHKGDLLVQLDMFDYKQKIKSLEGIASNNLSAKAELNTLLSQKEYYNIYSPQDGIVSNITVAAGSYVPNGSKVMTLFSDYDAKLIAYVTPKQYEEIQSKEKLSVYSKRLEQAFKVKLNGIGKITTDYQMIENNGKKIPRYELIFQFVNPDDGAVFIEQEALQFTQVYGNNDIKKPQDRVARLWNALIIGK